MRAVYHRNRLIDKFCRFFYTTCVWGLDLPDNAPKFLRCSKMRLEEGASDLFHALLFLGAIVLNRSIGFFRGLRYGLRDKVL